MDRERQCEKLKLPIVQRLYYRTFFFIIPASRARQGCALNLRMILIDNAILFLSIACNVWNVHCKNPNVPLNFVYQRFVLCYKIGTLLRPCLYTIWKCRKTRSHDKPWYYSLKLSKCWSHVTAFNSARLPLNYLNFRFRKVLLIPSREQTLHTLQPDTTFRRSTSISRVPPRWSNARDTLDAKLDYKYK